MAARRLRGMPAEVMTKTVHPMPPDIDESAGPVFREAMAQVASAVHLVTTTTEAGRFGLTATAFSSVSDAPPTVLVCVARTSRTLASILESGIFCVNTLAADDVELAEIFASRRGILGEERFATRRWAGLATGAPVLETALAAFDCRLVATHDIASHRVLIGEVAALGGQGAGASLIYRRRRFESV
ncbi:flavin reductase family protein [Bosea sp. (in: a-proteobacteria)]|uniref:flavin reductase family protein n=1 Tax=Bosea sp. (in: a-proteobacteria) TaxID=1871050 RepID=UPI003B3B3173